MKRAYLEDDEGNTYKLIDTGSVNFGGPLESLGTSFYDLWNNIAGYNAAATECMNDEYGSDHWLDMIDSEGNPLEDGWMEIYRYLIRRS